MQDAGRLEQGRDPFFPGKLRIGGDQIRVDQRGVQVSRRQFTGDLRIRIQRIAVTADMFLIACGGGEEAIQKPLIPGVIETAPAYNEQKSSSL